MTPRLFGCFFIISSMMSLGILAMTNPSNNASENRPPVQTPSGAEPSQSLENILRFISSGWDQLSRSETNCVTFTDVKIQTKPILYLPEDLTIPPSLNGLEKRCGVRVEHLPAKITQPGGNPLDDNQPNGLLYLKNPYVVPGGQFNEMYGWDSYFIIRGLIRDNRLDLAKGMVENFFFEIEHYGGVLNANRSYYLTRSQPPFLSSMVLAVFEAEKKSGRADLPWLARAYRYTIRDYEQWTHEPHLAGDTGLSRYFDHGEGPVPEIKGDPDHYYRGVAQYFLIHEGADSSHLTHVDEEHPAASLMGSLFPVYVCSSGTNSPDAAKCGTGNDVALTPDYYKGDRSMRESGFDVSFRFGPFGADTHHYAPVCLNSLLYKTEKDLEEMSTILGRPEDAQNWQRKALERQKLIVKYFWDESRGLFFDYDFTTHSQSSYEYATTFYPLWVGLATPQQASAVIRNLGIFEQAGGLAMGRRETEAQWDYPYGWAPIHLLAVEGLRRYGYEDDADRITFKFLTTVMRNFETDETIREKYNVVTQSDQTHIEAGYAQNVIGFGWTNGVFLELLNKLPPDWIARLR